MTYFNKKMKEFNDDGFKYLDCGGCAKIFKSNNIILKKYFRDVLEEDRISESVFATLKEIKHSNFIELYDLYFKKCNEVFLTPDAYTARYYEKDDSKVISKPIEFMLYNINELEKLFTCFTKNGILTSDIKKTNTIITKENIILIDSDSFIFDKDNPNLEIINKINLLKLFRSICLNEITPYEVNDVSKKINHFLLSIVNTPHIDVTLEISKQLSLYKRTIDYLNSRTY